MISNAVEIIAIDVSMPIILWHKAHDRNYFSITTMCNIIRVMYRDDIGKRMCGQGHDLSIVCVGQLILFFHLLG